MSVQKKEKATWEMLDRFFLRVLGEKEGTAVMAESREQAASFLAGSQETSPSRRALMQSTILPRVAVYTVSKRRGLDAEKLMEKYVREVQGPASHDRYAGLEWVPRFFSVFRWAFRKTTSSSDAWVSTFEEQPEEFDLTIHQCLWHDTCVSCGCPEVCRFFCECDNYAFGDLKKVGFRRTQTLGTGGAISTSTRNNRDGAVPKGQRRFSTVFHKVLSEGPGTGRCGAVKRSTRQTEMPAPTATPVPPPAVPSPRAVAGGGAGYPAKM